MANPFLVMGGVAVGVITATVGVLQVPGWIARGHDASAMNDIEQVTIVQAAARTTSGQYETSVTALNNAETGTIIRRSNGTRIGISVNGNDYVVVVQSASGRHFARVNGGLIGEGPTLSAAIAAAGGLPAGLTAPTPT